MDGWIRCSVVQCSAVLVTMTVVGVVVNGRGVGWSCNLSSNNGVCLVGSDDGSCTLACLRGFLNRVLELVNEEEEWWLLADDDDG